VKRWCRVYACLREAAEGSEFCRVKHGWQEIQEFALRPQPRALVRPRSWTRDEIVASIQRWALEHGRQPSQNDWLRSGDYHPSATTATKIFGTWGAALVAAGFMVPRGRPPRVTEGVESWFA